MYSVIGEEDFMQKIFIVIFLICIVFTALAQTEQYDYEVFVDQFDEFVNNIASTLPFNSSIGLNWSDAYIGQFPHFGAGVTVGATFMPSTDVDMLLGAFELSLDDIKQPEIKDFISNLGMPFPAVIADGRIGGFALPFDIGVKVGYLPPDFQIPGAPDNLVIDYLLLGADVRFNLLKGALIIPSVSVGGGLTYQDSAFSIPGILGSDVELTNIGGETLEMTDPALSLNWQTLVIDAKAQASWNLLIFTPYIGAGASYGVYARAGGGMKSDILLDGSPLTEQDIQDIEDACIAANQEPPELEPTEFEVAYETRAAWMFRLYGGVSLNLFIFKLDITGLFNVVTQDLGGSINLRLQL